MQKAKIALVEAGIIKSAGRGRISAEGHTWLKSQYDQGVRFSDWPKGEVTVTKSENGAASSVKVERTAQTTGKVISDIHYTYPEDEFEAYEFVNGKKSPVSMRECCNTCYSKFGMHVSLVAHVCETPVILGDRRVYIIRK